MVDPVAPKNRHLDIVRKIHPLVDMADPMVDLKLDMLVDLRVGPEVEALAALVVLEVMQILLVGPTKLMLGVSEMMLI